MKAACTVRDCDKQVLAKGYCAPHYHRVRRYGDPLGSRPFGPTPRPLLDRVAENVAYDGTCLLWLGDQFVTGYGRMVTGSMTDGTRRQELVHRVIHKLLIGPIPEGYEVDHVHARGCRHRLCCLPDHLEAVTKAENIRRGTWGLASRFPTAVAR